MMRLLVRLYGSWRRTYIIPNSNLSIFFLIYTEKYGPYLSSRKLVTTIGKPLQKPTNRQNEELWMSVFYNTYPHLRLMTIAEEEDKGT